MHVHELIDALTPEFAAAYANQSERPEVKRFSSLKDWHREFKKISKDSVVFTHVRPINIKSSMICVILHFCGAEIIGFLTGGVPNYSSLREEEDSKYRRVSLRVFHLFRRRLFSLLAPDQILVGGSEEEKRARKEFSRRTITIFGNSSDYSQILLRSGFLKSVKFEAVFLDTGFPGFLRDELLTGGTESVVPNDWYPRLNWFFDLVEKALGYATAIAIHPKHVGQDHSTFFGPRPAVGDQTMGLVSRSELVIATNSTAISYVVAFEKPLLLVTCDSIEKSKQRKRLEIRNCALETGSKIFNIDREYTELELREALVIDHAKRESYKRKYLTSRTDDKPNYQVLLDEVINAVD